MLVILNCTLLHEQNDGWTVPYRYLIPKQLPLSSHSRNVARAHHFLPFERIVFRRVDKFKVVGIYLQCFLAYAKQNNVLQNL